MSAIFISYRREDAEDSARALYESLLHEFGKDRLFMDVEAIALGSDFRQAVETSLDDCGVFLAVIGPDWLTAKVPNDPSGRRRLESPGDYVRQEIATALRRGARLPVIPVLVRGANMPPPDQLPDDLKDLAYRNALTLSHLDWDGNVRKLVTAIRPRVNDGSHPVEAGKSTAGVPAEESHRARGTTSTAVPPGPASSGRGLSKLATIGVPLLLIAAVVAYLAIHSASKGSRVVRDNAPRQTSATKSPSQECGIMMARNWNWNGEPPLAIFAIDGKITGKALLNNDVHERMPFECSSGEHRFLFQIEFKNGTSAECSGNFLVAEAADYRPEIHVTNFAPDKCALHRIAQTQP
jgi:hypothetical protein